MTREKRKSLVGASALIRTTVIACLSQVKTDHGHHYSYAVVLLLIYNCGTSKFFGHFLDMS